MQEAWHSFVGMLQKTARRRPTRKDLHANMARRLSKRTGDGSLPPDAFQNDDSLPEPGRIPAKKPTAKEVFQGQAAEGDQAV